MLPPVPCRAIIEIGDDPRLSPEARLPAQMNITQQQRLVGPPHGWIPCAVCARAMLAGEPEAAESRASMAPLSDSAVQKDEAAGVSTPERSPLLGREEGCARREGEQCARGGWRAQGGCRGSANR